MQICGICGKPLINNGRCIHCGNRQNSCPNGEFKSIDTNADSQILKSSADEVMPVISTSYDSNNQGGNRTSNSENQLSTIGMILAICSIFATMLAIPALIISIVALVQANNLQGAGRKQAIVGLVISSILILACVVLIIFIIPVGI